MESAKFVLTPFYEYMDTVIPLTKLQITNRIPDGRPGRFICYQMTEFVLQLNHSFLLSESKKLKNKRFDIRPIIRFSNSENMNIIDNQIVLKDSFPIHLKMSLNNVIISLPQFLPNDRSGKDGRRFPRPVDLLEGFLHNPLMINKFLMQWIQDESKNQTFYFVIYLVRRRTCEELTQILFKKQLCPIKNTLNFILEQSNEVKNCQDDDLMILNVPVSTSLVCPVSRVRMTTPGRGMHCIHLQCFDCITYLIMNFNKPTWQCPVCDKTTFFHQLEIDSFIFCILKDQNSSLVTNIIFNKKGQWKQDKNMSGMAAEDKEEYNNINAYFNKSIQPNLVKSPSSVVSVHSTEIERQKYMHDFLKSANQESLIKKFYTANNLNNMVPTLPRPPNSVNATHSLFPESAIHRQSYHTGSNLARNNQLFDKNEIFPDIGFEKTTVKSSMDAGNINHSMPVNSHLPSQIKIDPMVNTLLRYNSFCGSRKKEHKSHKGRKHFVEGENSQIKITDVISVGKYPSESGCIVISDEENIDLLQSKPSANVESSRERKRPSTVSSVPSTTSSVKHQKSEQNYGTSDANMRVDTASVPTIIDSHRNECCCKPNNMCRLHRKYLLSNRPVRTRQLNQTSKSNIDLPMNDNLKKILTMKYDQIMSNINNPNAPGYPLLDSNKVRELLYSVQNDLLSFGMDSYLKTNEPTNSKSQDTNANIPAKNFHKPILDNTNRLSKYINSIPERLESQFSNNNSNMNNEQFKRIEDHFEKLCNSGKDIENIFGFKDASISLQTLDSLYQLTSGDIQKQWRELMVKLHPSLGMSGNQASQFNFDQSPITHTSTINPFLNPMNKFYQC